MTRKTFQAAATMWMLAAAGLCGSRVPQGGTALDRYVYAPDASYRYTLDHSTEQQGVTVHVLSMISQQWRSAQEVDQPEWHHWLVVAQPKEVKTSTALLMISGGSIGRPAPKSADAAVIAVALGTGSVVADLRGIPNEPLKFADESATRNEDAIIAYSWDKYLKTGDDTWPLRLPMTKAAVRAMDTVTSFLASHAGIKVDRFAVAGGSKRGWTAWTTAAVDDRVIAVLPFVIDVLNCDKSLENHFRAYGFWAPSLQDYIDMGLMNMNGTAAWKALMNIEDPYSYRKRLTIPKYVVNSAGDQYFTPDSSRFYFDDLPGEKYLRYVPNTKHNLRNSDAVLGLAAFYESVVNARPRPRFSWQFKGDGSIVVRVQDKPAQVKLWQANNPDARDFRLDTIGPAYKESPLEPGPDGTYVARVQKPARGWTAYFVELVFPGGGKYPLKFTTGVRIAPDTLPFPSPPKR
jgi:PhoPQ-activated pathogenicity-related protein